MLNQSAIEKVKLSRAAKNLCPYCESSDIEGEEVDIGPGEASQYVSCSDCEKNWTEQYTLTEVVDHED